jgi:hypothetical protein
MQVVSSAEQFMHAIAIGAICFIADSGLIGIRDRR